MKLLNEEEKRKMRNEGQEISPINWNLQRAAAPTREAAWCGKPVSDPTIGRTINWNLRRTAYFSPVILNEVKNLALFPSIQEMKDEILRSSE